MPGMLEGLQTILCEQQSCNYLDRQKNQPTDVRSQQGQGGGRNH